MNYEEELYHLLEKEYGYYSVILEITTQEHDLFHSQRPLREITPLMKKKKILLSCIEELQNSLRPLKTQWQQKKDLSLPIGQQVQKKYKDLDNLLKNILNLDRDNRKMLESYLLTLQGKKLKATAEAGR